MRPAATLALLLCTAPALALDAKPPGPGWEEANRTDTFVIFAKDNPAALAREIRVFTEVEAAPAVVHRVVGDFAAYTEFMPYVNEVKILKKTTEDDLVVYFALSLPLVSNRDYAIRIRRSENAGVFRTEWTAESGALPEREGLVRVKLNTGGWLLEPLDGGRRTRVTYSLLTAPGGSIPQWVANKSNTASIPDLMTAVRARSTNPRWKRP